jgi:hypothetical protein
VGVTDATKLMAAKAKTTQRFIIVSIPGNWPLWVACATGRAVLEFFIA